MKDKYKLTILDETTMERKLSFRLSKLNVFVALGVITISTVIITTFIISVTPLKEYIPGYYSIDQLKLAYDNKAKIDSLTEVYEAYNTYLQNIKETVFMGIVPQAEDSIALRKKPNVDYKNIKDVKSPEDSILRKEWDERSKYEVTYYPGKQTGSGLSSINFFAPIKGLVTSGFDPKIKHYGIDVAGPKNSQIKSTLDGTVIVASWSYENGYMVIIQHSSNLISVYKHNSSLLVKTGGFVQAGDIIAIIGNSGEYTSGPHLHFELWYNGSPVNPNDFITFE